MNNFNDLNFTELRDITYMEPTYKFKLQCTSGEMIYFDATKDNLQNLIVQFQAALSYVSDKDEG